MLLPEMSLPFHIYAWAAATMLFTRGWFGAMVTGVITNSVKRDRLVRMCVLHGGDNKQGKCKNS